MNRELVESFIVMKLVIYPAVEELRYSKIAMAASPMSVVNANEMDIALREIRDAEAFFGKITPELLARAERLLWVQSPTASLEHYLFPELIEHSCVLSNMRGLYSDVIADHVMGFVLCFARNLHTYIRRQERGEWSPVGNQEYLADFTSGPGTVLPTDLAHQHLSDCTLGVIGVGQIGSEIARRASAFGMTVVGADPKNRSVPGTLDEIWPIERMPHLLEVSDYVVIAAPHTPETYKLFRRSVLRQMKSTAVLINIGRGAIVDVADLTDALRAGEIAGAALDVCDPEPLPSNHPLWRMPNVIITPHIAAASPRISDRHLQTLLENIRRFVAGKPLSTQVDKRLWY